MSSGVLLPRGAASLSLVQGRSLNGFILIAPDVFRHFEVTDWRNCEAVNAAGERLFSIHVAAPHFGSPAHNPHKRRPKPGSKSEKVCNYVQLAHPNGKPLGLSYHALQKELEEANVHASEATVRQAVQEYLGWP